MFAFSWHSQRVVSVAEDTGAVARSPAGAKTV